MYTIKDTSLKFQLVSDNLGSFDCAVRRHFLPRLFFSEHSHCPCRSQKKLCFHRQIQHLQSGSVLKVSNLNK